MLKSLTSGKLGDSVIYALRFGSFVRVKSAMDYLILKWIHIVSSTVLFGTGIGLAFFFFVAHLDSDLCTIRFATRLVVLGDFLFTTPAGIVQVLSSFSLARTLGMNFYEAWFLAAMVLFVFAGLCWLPVVRIQLLMRNMAQCRKSGRCPTKPLLALE